MADLEVSGENRWKRAWSDTNVPIWKEFIVAPSTAFILYWFVSEQDFSSQLIKMCAGAVSAMVILPIFIFVVNYIRAPLRIARDEIAILRSKLGECESGKGEANAGVSRRVIDLGAIKGDITLDMSEGDYFSTVLVGNGELRLPINPPKRGLVGSFNLKLTVSDRCILTLQAGFVLPNDFYLSEEGADVITGETVDGGRSWRLAIARGQFLKEFAALPSQFKIPHGSKCCVIEENFLFSQAERQFADWTQAFPVEATAVRMRFMLRWEPRSVPKVIGTHSVVFRVYGPKTRFGVAEKFVRVEIACEVVSESGAYIQKYLGWSEATEEVFIHPTDAFNFRIEREMQENKGVASFDVVVSAVAIKVLGRSRLS